MYVLMDIGCILTGQQSRLVGTFEELSKAQKTQSVCEEKYGVPSGGRHKFMIYPMGQVNTINDHYRI